MFLLFYLIPLLVNYCDMLWIHYWVLRSLRGRLVCRAAQPACGFLCDDFVPCGSFKYGSLCFIPRHFEKNTQPIHKRKPKLQVGPPPPPSKSAVCMGEGHLLKQMSSIQEKRGVTHIPVICQVSHSHIYSDAHTHKQRHTHSSSGCSVTLYIMEHCSRCLVLC